MKALLIPQSEILIMMKCILFFLVFFEVIVQNFNDKEMVLIPEGNFLMGCNVKEECRGDDQEHIVYLSSFWIDKTEVTVMDYKLCVNAAVCTEPINRDPLIEADQHTNNWFVSDRFNHPINAVTWEQAKDYCDWKGKRLPTEAEWEKAARGDDGRLYPWGNQAPTCELAIIFQSTDSFSGCNHKHTWPVGSVPKGASAYGVLDMAGNVSEWVSDHYKKKYYSSSPLKNPSGPADMIAESYRVVRGGHFSSEGGDLKYRYGLRTYQRGYIYPHEAYNFVGFRCAKNQDEND